VEKAWIRQAVPEGLEEGAVVRGVEMSLANGKRRLVKVIGGSKRRNWGCQDKRVLSTGRKSFL
jgi:hypothetical protein